MEMEKKLVEILSVEKITETQVEVIVKKTGKKLVLPVSQTERFGSRLYISSWLARKKGIQDKIQ